MPKKVITTTNSSSSHNVDFKCTGKPAHTAPVIIESYVDDATGEVIHILANGNTQSDTSYMAVWGKPKGKINWKAKGVNPDKRHLFFK